MTTSVASTTTLAELSQHSRQQLQQLMRRAGLKAWPTALQKSISHSLLAPSKLFRPLLVYTIGLAQGARLQELDAAALAVECVHTYSLIHDDLPAMDNADIRRGLISNHKAHGDALAILAGDGLLSLAFELITESPLPPDVRLQQVHCLATSSGPVGMVGGQVLDLQNNAQTTTEVQYVHDLKTGALIRCCMKLAFLAANQAWCNIAEQFATELGRLYQLQDDWLDHCAQESILGKPCRADPAQHKNTALSFRSPDETHAELQQRTARVNKLATQLATHDSALVHLIKKICQRQS